MRLTLRPRSTTKPALLFGRFLSKLAQYRGSPVPQKRRLPLALAEIAVGPADYAALPLFSVVNALARVASTRVKNPSLAFSAPPMMTPLAPLRAW